MFSGRMSQTPCCLLLVLILNGFMNYGGDLLTRCSWLSTPFEGLLHVAAIEKYINPGIDTRIDVTQDHPPEIYVVA